MKDQPVYNVKGEVEVTVRGQDALPPWQRRIIRDALNNGEDASQDLKFGCRIALDVNEAFENLEGVFTLNPKAKAQFGKNAQGLPYLTVGIINRSSGEKLRLHWEGDAVPRRMIQVAVKHDEGLAVRTAKVKLDLSRAQIWQLGAKDGRVRKDDRTRHDTNSTGLPYSRPVRRTHRRMCRDDLKNL